MKTEQKKEVDEMDTRYRNAHKDFDKVFNRMGKKDMYFILKKYYRHVDGAYKPEFNI